MPMPRCWIKAFFGSLFLPDGFLVQWTYDDDVASKGRRARETKREPPARDQLRSQGREAARGATLIGLPHPTYPTPVRGM